MSSTPNNRLFGNNMVVPVQATFTGTTLASIWTPSGTRRITFKGCALRAHVQTALAAATPGDAIYLFDNTTGGARLVNLGAIRSATDAPGIDYGFVAFDLDLGQALAAAGNLIKVGTTATIGAGVIAVTGFVFGDEIG